MSDDRRNEGQLLLGVLGVETLLDRMAETQQQTSRAPTATNLLGPFWRSGTPLLEMGSSIILNPGSYKGHRAHMSGKVLDHATGNPIEGAELDIWQSAPNGLYDSQDPEQPDMNLRGRFVTGPDGSFNFICLVPTCYSIPNDGPAGKLLRMLDRHTMRPAHIHFILTANKYKSLTTELFDRNDRYIANDTVFAVKESLIVDFVPTEDNPMAEYSLQYNFSLAPI